MASTLARPPVSPIEALAGPPAGIGPSAAVARIKAACRRVAAGFRTFRECARMPIEARPFEMRWVDETDPRRVRRAGRI